MIPSAFSIPWLTLHLGFDFNSDEYKIMGLAPYGDPERFRAFFEKTVELRPTARFEFRFCDSTAREKNARTIWRPVPISTSTW